MRLNVFSRAAAVALVGVVAAVAGCTASHSYKAGPETLVVTRADAGRAGLSPRWQRQVGLTEGETISEIWRVGDSLYVSTSDHQLHSINAAAGTTNWVADMGKAAIHIYRPQETKGAKYVYVITRGRVFAIDKRLGDITTSHDLGFSATCDPIVTEDTLCVGGADRYHGLYYDPLAGVKWGLAAPHDFFVARPVLQGGGLFVASQSGLLWRLNPKTGSPDWFDRKTNGEVKAPLTADASRLYIPCMDRRLYCFDANNGRPLWDTRLDGTLDQAALAAGASVLCVGRGKGLYCLNSSNGEIKWNLPGVEQIISRSGDHVYAADGSGSLLSIAMDTGTVDSKLSLANVLEYVPNDLDGLIFAVTRDGRIAALEAAK